MPGVAAVAIPAAASIAGAYMSNRGQKNASKAESEALDKAIAYQKEQAAAAKAERAAAARNWQQRYDAYLEKFYGWKPSGGGGGGGVSASSGGGGGAIPAGFASAGVGSSAGYTPGDNIAALMMRQGQIRADSARNSGNIWGQGIAQAGAGIGKAIGSGGEQSPSMMGQFQPSGVAQPGMTPWQPAPMGRGPQDDWTNWQRYYGGFGVGG